jgi:hypothetical protein
VSVDGVIIVVPATFSQAILGSVVLSVVPGHKRFHTGFTLSIIFGKKQVELWMDDTG